MVDHEVRGIRIEMISEGLEGGLRRDQGWIWSGGWMGEEEVVGLGVG